VFDIVSGVMCFKHVAYKLFALSPSSLLALCLSETRETGAREQFTGPRGDTRTPERTVYFSYFRAPAHLLLSRRVLYVRYITLHPLTPLTGPLALID